MMDIRTSLPALSFFRVLILFGCIVNGSTVVAETALQHHKITLIKDATLIITMDPNLGEGPLGLIRHGSITIEDDIIRRLGDSGDHVDEVIDASGMIVLPGFVDAHNHLWQTLIRGCGTDKELPGWLDECMWPVSQSLDESDTYAFVRLSTVDLINTGVTTTLDWSIASNEAMIKGNIRALEDSGLRFVFAYFDSNCTIEDCSKAKSTRDAIIELKRKFIDPNPLAGLQTASHPIPFLEPSMRNMVQLAKELSITFNVHLYEHKDSPHMQLNGMELLEKSGAFSGQLMINHAVHLSKDDISKLAQHDVRVAHNPLSNMRLASGVMPLPEIHLAGLTVGLGLDGGANDTSDVFSLMRAAVGLQRAKYMEANVFPTVPDVLRLATMGGAKALGLEKIIGSLTPGKQADIIIIDPHQVNFAPDWNLVNQIVFNARPVNVSYVLVAGRLLKKEGRLLVDSKKYVEDAETAIKRFRSRYVPAQLKSN
ncbi:MAG: amidohydrolase family protein [Proteobacteria bacterium]|nr:amidohydrolase family protein [Pseudomonadota bacterium]